MYEIEQRIKYEIMLEFGLAGKIGRTLEKSNCSVISDIVNITLHFFLKDVRPMQPLVLNRSIAVS